jgi:hypothetical protein
MVNDRVVADSVVDGHGFLSPPPTRAAAGTSR